MDKKNTLLLTVIAVATLLVAVVGATFAYFSLSATGTATTTATVKTGKVGTITMNSPTPKLYLDVTAADMAESVSQTAAKDYWATNESKSVEDGSIVSNYKESEESYKVSTVTLSGADKGTKYHCTAKFNVTITGLEGLNEQLQEEDGLLKLTTESSSATVNIAEGKDGSSKVQSINHTLKDLVALSTSGKDFWVIYDFTSTGGEDTADLKASFKLTNRKDESESEGPDDKGVQNYLAGKDITLTIKAAEESDADGKLTCNIVQPEA